MVPYKSQGGAEQLANVEVLGGSAAKNATPAGGSGKQRLRWTSDLHDRFVDAITQLGGPDSGYFFSILRLIHFMHGFFLGNLLLSCKSV